MLFSQSYIKTRKFVIYALTSLGCLFGILISIYLFFSVVNISFLIFNLQKDISLQDLWEASKGETQTLVRLQDRVRQIPIPQKTTFISEYGVSNICCGQGETHRTWPIVTRLYESGLTKDEIRAFYESYQGGLYFVDEVIEIYPDRRVNIPCYPFNLLSGHKIPEKLPKNKNMYIIIDSDSYLPPNPKIVYCN